MVCLLGELKNSVFEKHLARSMAPRIAQHQVFTCLLTEVVRYGSKSIEIILFTPRKKFIMSQKSKERSADRIT